MPERFSRDQVDAILGRAIERDRSTGDLSHEQLMDIAKEIGVSSDSIERAIQEITVEQKDQQDLVRLRREAWRGLLFHLVPYVCVNSLLATINYFTTSFPWALFPIMGWGIGLLSHLLAVVFPNPERLNRLLQRERERERRRELKRQMKYGAKQLESAVGEGVVALLHAAADRIQAGAGASQGAVRPRVRVDSVSHPGDTHDQATSESNANEHPPRANRRD